MEVPRFARSTLALCARFLKEADTILSYQVLRLSAAASCVHRLCTRQSCADCQTLRCQVTTAYAPRLWGGDQSISRPDARELVTSQHKLILQANAYTNSTFCIAAGRSGEDDGIHPLISSSLIVDPQGRIVAECATEEE